jgi:hypothetical protein
LAATAQDTDGTVQQVAYYANGTLVGTADTSPYAVSWNGVSTGTYAISAVATDDDGATTTSAPVTITVGAASLGAASFSHTDSVTRGNWKGAYGTTASLLANGPSQIPPTISVTPTGQQNWTWTDVTSDVRALETTGSSRLAATWYGNTFDIQVNAGAGSRRVALYMLDWENANRAQTIEVRQSGTNQLLDSRTAWAFNGGQYLVWQVTGQVTFRVIRTSGYNAVVSAVFID